MKKFLVLLMAAGSAWVILGIIGFLFGSIDERHSLPSVVKAAVLLVTFVISAWWLLRYATSVQRLFFYACALGAVEWFATYGAIRVYRGRAISLLKDSGLSKLEMQGKAAELGVLTWFDVIGALFFTGLCIVGLLFTKGARGKPAVAVSPAKAPARVPSRDAAIRLVLGEIIVVMATFTLVTWARNADLGLAVIYLILLMLPIAGAILLLAVAGLVQGIRLCRFRQYRVLGAFVAIFSAVPVLIAAIGYSSSLASLTQDDQRAISRQADYQRLATFFQEPRSLEGSRRTNRNEVVFTFSDSVEVEMVTFDGVRLAHFCNEYMIGKTVEVRLPSEDRFRREPFVDVFYNGERIDRYWDELVQIDKQYGQSKVYHAAWLIAPRSAPEPWKADATAAKRIAKQLRPFADADGSGFLDEVEGRAFEDMVKFGLGASSMIKAGGDRALIAKSAKVSVDDLDARAREYNDLARRILDAGIAEMPLLDLPDDDG